MPAKIIKRIIQFRWRYYGSYYFVNSTERSKFRQILLWLLTKYFELKLSEKIFSEDFLETWKLAVSKKNRRTSFAQTHFLCTTNTLDQTYDDSKKFTDTNLFSSSNVDVCYLSEQSFFKTFLKLFPNLSWRTTKLNWDENKSARSKLQSHACVNRKPMEAFDDQNHW